MELKAYLSVLLRKWWIVLPVFLITLTVAIFLTYTQTPLYRATTTYVVVPSPSFGDVKSFASGLDLLGRRDEIATTFAEIASSRSIRELAMNSIALDSDSRYTVSSQLRAGTNIIEFTADGPDPTVTRDLANAIGATTEEYVKGSYEAFVLRPLDEAVAPRSPISPNKSLNIALAILLGLILGGGLAFLSVYLEGPAGSTATINIIDAETGIYSKDYFLRRLSNEMVRAKRNRYPLSVALMRIDNLDMLKGFGSAKASADILQQVAALSKQYLREEDILAYLGNNIFGVILPDMNGENAKAVMEYLQTRVGFVPLQSVTDGAKLNLKGTVGVSSYNHNGTSRDDLVAQADRALQLAEVNENGGAVLIAEPVSGVNHKHG